jgi:hypothetical protein
MFPLVRLASKYKELTTNGRLLSNRASIDVVRERIRQLAERIDTNQAPNRLANLQKLWLNFRELEKRGDTLETIVVKKQLDDEFEAAYHDYAAWRQMFDAIDLDRKLVESEVKIAKDIQAILTAEDAYELTAKILAAIIETTNAMTEIPQDAKSKFLQRMQYEFTKLVGDEADRGVGRSHAEIIDSESSEVD